MDEESPYGFDDLVSLMQQNFSSIIEKVKGLKILVLDNSTSKIISLVLTHSYLLQNEVLLTLNINSLQVEPDEIYGNSEMGGLVPGSDPNLRHLKSVFVIEPNVDNVNRLCSELKCPTFKSYHLFFTNKLDEGFLEILARADQFNIINGVYEYFIDINVLHTNLFTINNFKICNNTNASSIINTLNTNNTYNILKTAGNDTLDNNLMRCVNSLFSVCCLLNQIPTIVYRKNNVICQTLSNKLQMLFNNNNLNLQSILQQYNKYNTKLTGVEGVGCVLLVLDRKDDLVVPLMNQWTYRAMIHELIGINNNKIVVDDSEFVLNDHFFNSHIFHEFVHVEEDLNTLISQNKLNTINTVNIVKSSKTYNTNNTSNTLGTGNTVENTVNISSVAENVENVLENIPEKNRMINDVMKHVKILHELSKIIQENKLLDSGLLEQDIATNRRNTLNDVIEYITDKNNSYYEKVRIALLFTLTCNDSSKIKKVKDYLMMGKMDELVSLVDHATELVKGKKNANRDEFTISTLKDKITKVSLDTQSPYLQFKSNLYATTYNLIKGKLDSEMYVMVPSAYDLGYTLKHKPASVTHNASYTIYSTIYHTIIMVIIFMVGGVTYGETCDCNIISRATGVPIILGGSCVHNSKSFLSDFFNFPSK
ncbi:Sec1 family protein [Theileria parva strain Muguga]|uniref:Vacuolar sorting protein 45, putative n=1 Tax=Theileria parva TaxID=5875 RepID=Q4MZF3_THEPA|nr:Sec1 family protein [Theileria parva strain Muguga]EAN31312.1 Sec1 family protein [Theileria parva strain Muguga]|eukprot:XP_763595.1 vacuolar sorting protein 45 [Theileria parva strain Muguga]